MTRSFDERTKVNKETSTLNYISISNTSKKIVLYKKTTNYKCR